MKRPVNLVNEAKLTNIVIYWSEILDHDMRVHMFIGFIEQGKQPFNKLQLTEYLTKELVKYGQIGERWLFWDSTKLKGQSNFVIYPLAKAKHGFGLKYILVP